MKNLFASATSKKLRVFFTFVVFFAFISTTALAQSAKNTILDEWFSPLSKSYEYKLLSFKQTETLTVNVTPKNEDVTEMSFGWFMRFNTNENPNVSLFALPNLYFCPIPVDKTVDCLITRFFNGENSFNLDDTGGTKTFTGLLLTDTNVYPQTLMQWPTAYSLIGDAENSILVDVGGETVELQGSFNRLILSGKLHKNVAITGTGNVNIHVGPAPYARFYNPWTTRGDGDDVWDYCIAPHWQFYVWKMQTTDEMMTASAQVFGVFHDLEQNTHKEVLTIEDHGYGVFSHKGLFRVMTMGIKHRPSQYFPPPQRFYDIDLFGVFKINSWIDNATVSNLLIQGKAELVKQNLMD